MSELESLKDRVTKLEELVTHQEHLLEQLNELALQLRAENRGLETGFRERLERIEASIESQALPFDPDEKPPHY